MGSMPRETVDAVITDPPYGMAFQSNMAAATKDWQRLHRMGLAPSSPKRFDAIENDAGFDAEWQLAWMRECHRVLRADRHFYAFCNDLHLGEFRETAEAAGFTLKRTLVWVKDAGSMGDLEGDYQHKTELVVFAHKGRRPLFHGRRPNVLEIPRVPPGQMQHPTEKPVALVRQLVLNSTHHGETILDPFA